MNYTDINGFYNRYLGLPPLKNDQHPWGVSTRSLLPSRQCVHEKHRSRS